MTIPLVIGVNPLQTTLFELGIVSGRVALLLRSAEIHPVFVRFVQMDSVHPLPSPAAKQLQEHQAPDCAHTGAVLCKCCSCAQQTLRTYLLACAHRCAPTASAGSVRASQQQHSHSYRVCALLRNNYRNTVRQRPLVRTSSLQSAHKSARTGAQ